MKKITFTITLESNLTKTQEVELFIDLQDTINKFEEYHCIDINNLNIISNTSDISEMNREPSGLKTIKNNKDIYIQTEIVPLFTCSNCKEEVENECSFELNKTTICRKCYEELEEDESNESLENICDWCGYELNGTHDDTMCKYLNR